MNAPGGKGFGGGEATRDPAPTFVDPNDPKGKQQAIHKAESFADYLARRSGGGGAAPAPAPSSQSAPAPGGKGFGGGEATRDPEPTNVDPNDPKGKQQAIHKAESFADYLARRGGASTSISAPAAAPPAAAPPAAPPAAPLPGHIEVHTGAGKGFGGGEATRNPEATVVDPNDPKGKQQAIHKAESFADYLAKRQA
jgi:hypothetical protein